MYPAKIHMHSALVVAVGRRGSDRRKWYERGVSGWSDKGRAGEEGPGRYKVKRILKKDGVGGRINKG